ncbi:MAG TPA: LuxR C-terminal-related transcriptional regulator [Gaiellaceae bacterium]|nr:LuxR C-terminal-related transcriptional regulator [Gaiellaceae bacterium]
MTSALDGSTATIRLLIASAGWGKTTLAEQWAATPGRRTAWYRVRDASADVAVLAVDLAEAASLVVPHCDRRLRERLGASSRPSDEAEVLAGLLAQDLAGWPADAWLVLDDYHLLDGSAEAVLFLETLFAAAPLNVLIASRRRPAWVTTRHVLYGEIFELGQSALAMSREEAEEVLADWRREQASGLIALAEGWPALIGLAGVVPLPSDPGSDVPDELYTFFAEEVFQALEPDVRSGLGLVAVAPSLDRELARALLGQARAERVLEQAITTGIIDERPSGLDLHPLARQFLDLRTAVELAGERASAIARCRDIYRQRRDWDAVFTLVRRHGLEEELEGLLEEALDELIGAARLTTVETWVDRAERRGFDAPVFRLARAELNLRQGNHLAAQTLAEAVASEVPEAHPLRFRALMTAAEAAHVAAKEESALALFRYAEENAQTPSEEREALWGQLMCMTELELDDASKVLSDLASGVPSHDARELLRESGRRLGLELKLGSLESLDEARERAQLLAHVKDAVVRASFRCVFSIALTLDADYELAAYVAEEMIADAEEHRLDFALPYGYAAAAGASAGRKRYVDAHEALELGLSMSRRMSNFHAEDNARALQIRVLTQQGRHLDACAVEPRSPKRQLRSLRGELFASRALALACVGRLEEAVECVRAVRGTTGAIETRVLVQAVEAIVAIRNGKKDALAEAELLLEETIASGGVDLLATSYRASPELLAVLLGALSTRERTWSLLIRAGDAGIASAAGYSSPQEGDPLASLSKREREIYDLLCQGLSNKQIAGCLFISEATVKAHAHHVYDKLGIRSRKALALEAARRRSRYAAPATTDGYVSSGRAPSAPSG